MDRVNMLDWFKRPIKNLMTEHPVTINAKLSLKEAEQLMLEKKIRHLPVLQGGRLVGMITMSDLKAFSLEKNFQGKEIKIEDVYSFDPIVVQEEENLFSVISLMREKGISSVVVENNGKKVSGIFTLVDVMRELEKLGKDIFKI